MMEEALGERGKLQRSLQPRLAVKLVKKVSEKLVIIVKSLN